MNYSFILNNLETNPKSIVRRFKDFAIEDRRFIYSRNSNQELAKELYKLEREAYLRRDAVACVFDVDFFKEVASDDKNEGVRLFAVRRIISLDKSAVSFLSERLKLDHSELVRNTIKLYMAQLPNALKYMVED